LTIFEMAEKVGSGLKNLKLCPVIKEWNDLELSFIGIYSKNTMEYLISDIGSCIQGITIVPIYDTLGEEATEFAFEQTKMQTCFISSTHLESIY